MSGYGHSHRNSPDFDNTHGEAVDARIDELRADPKAMAEADARLSGDLPEVVYAGLEGWLATIGDMLPPSGRVYADDLGKLPQHVIARLAEAARTGSAQRDELSGSTITITSLGALGGIVTTPVINHPEVAIVGVNKMIVRPVWDGNQFIPRKIMNLSSSFDHRIVDGWDAAVFVQRIKALLETPALIFIEG